ncbi:MAG: alpha/beta hydrolase [Acidimicrobiales bacterium]
MPIEMVSIETGSTPLDGLLHLPDGEIRGAVQLMHGNTMNFYVGPPRFLPAALTELGLACLAYNRRGHDVLSNRDSRDLEGGAFQTIGEAIEDNRLARLWMERRGLPTPFVVGHSNGGMLAVRHVVDHPDTPGLALLSAHRGGTSIMRLMAANGLMAADRYDEITRQARELVAAGEGRQLLLVPGWWYVISANTYVEFLDRCPDIVEMADRIPCPTLFIRSREEPRTVYPAEELADRAMVDVDVRVLDAGGHYYVGHENLISNSVASFLAPLIP